MPQVPLATRLQVYGISPAAVQLTDLDVPSGQQVILKSDDAKLSKQTVKLVPKSIDDVKRWVGIADSAFSLPSQPHLQPVLRTALPVSTNQPTLTHLQPVLEPIMPVHEQYTSAEDSTLRNLAASYVYGHTATVSAAQLPALNKWISVIAPYIPITLWNDIHVAAGATLVVYYSILFARYITIDHGGKIQMKITRSLINCAGVKGT